MDKSGIPGGSDWFLKPGLRKLSTCFLPMRTETVTGGANSCLQSQEGCHSGVMTHNVLLTLPSLMEKIQSLNIVTLSSSYKSNTKKLTGQSQHIRTVLQLGRYMCFGYFVWVSVYFWALWWGNDASGCYSVGFAKGIFQMEQAAITIHSVLLILSDLGIFLSF